MKNYIFYIFLGIYFAFCSCSPYRKVLKSGTNEEKLVVARKYFEDKNWNKTIEILEPIRIGFRGTSSSEDVESMYAYSHYMSGDNISASFLLERFTKDFPQSEKNEDYLFKAGYSSYKEVPFSGLDQADTKKAIETLQKFIEKYPDSENLKVADKLIRELNQKLFKKAYDVAMNYFKLEDYYAATIAFGSMLDDYPATTYREASMFYRFRAAFVYAENSIDIKKKERFTEAVSLGKVFVKSYPSSRFFKEAQAQLNRAELELKIYSNPKDYDSKKIKNLRKQTPYYLSKNVEYTSILDKHKKNEKNNSLPESNVDEKETENKIEE